MKYNYRVKDSFRYHYGCGDWVDVPAGTATESATAHHDGGQFRFAVTSIFPAGSLDRFTADHYGIRVPIENHTFETA